jgi:hypothetical protein
MLGNVGKTRTVAPTSQFSNFSNSWRICLKQHEMLREALQALHLPHLVPILALTPSCVHFASCSPAI